MKQIISLLLFFILFINFIFTVCASTQNPNVLIVEISGTIDQSTVEILSESMKEAENNRIESIILILNTPGGGLKQTFEIAEMIQNSEIPIIGFVYPKGSTAWSAGTFILLSTHIAAMANHTIIGSCQPVEITFEGTKFINESKTINALVEWIQERAVIHGRNNTLAKEFITINRNVNATIAKEKGVIDFVSDSINELLIKIDGINITISGENLTLNTKDANKVIYTPSFKIQLIKHISNPILTSLLLMIGIFALILGISSPGFGAEVFGVIAIILSLVGSGFAISEISIIFIIIGCLFLIVEIFATPGFGVIGIGGIICLFIGSIFLVPTYSTRKWMINMTWTEEVIIVLIVIAILISIFFGFLLYKILQIRNKKKAIGVFIGETAKTIDRITPENPGYIRFKGEYWKAKSDMTIEPNKKVIILKKEESILVIKPIE